MDICCILYTPNPILIMKAPILRPLGYPKPETHAPKGFPRLRHGARARGVLAPEAGFGLRCGLRIRVWGVRV